MAWVERLALTPRDKGCHAVLGQLHDERPLREESEELAVRLQSVRAELAGPGGAPRLELRDGRGDGRVGTQRLEELAHARILGSVRRSSRLGHAAV